MELPNRSTKMEQLLLKEEKEGHTRHKSGAETVGFDYVSTAQAEGQYSQTTSDDGQTEHVHKAEKVHDLTELPEELLFDILRYASHAAFVCLSQTCQKLRRISMDTRLEDQDRWQLAELQSCWFRWRRGRITTNWTDPPPRQLITTKSHSQQLSLQTRFIDNIHSRAELGEQLRKDLFCTSCRSEKGGSEKVQSLLNGDLFRPRRCIWCPGYPSHPAWEFLSHGVCLRRAKVIRLCPHQVRAPHQVCAPRHVGAAQPGYPRYPDHSSQSRQHVVHCQICDMETWTWSSVPTWDRLGSMSLHTSWTLRRDDAATPLAALLRTPNLDTRELATQLVDRYRLHERLYLCPHHPIDGDRERCVRQLMPLLDAFRACPDNTYDVARRWQRLPPTSFLGTVACLYCDVRLSLQPCGGGGGGDDGQGQGEPGDFRLRAAHLWRRPWHASRDYGGPGVAPALAMLHPAAALNPDHYSSAFLRHPDLRHLTWCDEDRCATNRRGAAHLPALLARCGLQQQQQQQRAKGKQPAHNNAEDTRGIVSGYDFL